MPFPTAFPGEAYLKVAVTLKSLATGQKPPFSRREALEAAYDVLGHLTDQALTLLGDESMLMAEAVVSGAEAAKWFETMGGADDAETQAAWSVPAWAIPIIMELVRKLLEGSFGS